MPEVRVKLIDQKGEKVRQSFTVGTFNPATYLTDIAPLSYCGTEGYITSTEADFSDDVDVTVNTLVNNDSDFRAVCTFKYLSSFIRLQIPAVKVNIEAGLVVRLGEKRSYIPLNKSGTEVGIDGAALATRMEGVLGLSAGDLSFSSGRIVKRA